MEVLMIWLHVLAALFLSALLSVSLGWLLLRWIFGRPLVRRSARRLPKACPVPPKIHPRVGMTV